MLRATFSCQARKTVAVPKAALTQALRLPKKPKSQHDWRAAHDKAAADVGAKMDAYLSKATALLEHRGAPASHLHHTIAMRRSGHAAAASTRQALEKVQRGQ